MPSPDDIEQQQRLLATYRRTLADWRNQQAQFGIHTPSHVLHSIRKARDEIRQIKTTLDGWGVDVEDHPDDRPTTNDQRPTTADEPLVIPSCPQPNAGVLFGRADFISGLAVRLTSGSGAVAISAVRGLPGVGKSDLLRATGNDARIKAHFTGGVLYAELGPSPDLSQWLRRWIAALGHEPPRSDDADTLAGALRAALAPRRALLIVDDVWEASLRAAKALRDCGSPACRVLASSRSPQVAQEMARGAAPLELDVLAQAPALELLRHGARDGDVDVVARDEGGAAALVAALGGLPLALKLAGGWLRTSYRQPRYRAHPCDGLLKVWREKLDELRGYEQRPALDGQLSLDAIIGLSYAALPDDPTRAAAAALAAFGAAPLDWDWDAMAAVWATDEDTTATLEQALVASGLVDYDAESGRYSLHQTVEAFLARRADPAVYERHVAYYAALMLKHGWETLGRFKGDVEAALATLDREIGQIERGQQRAADAEPAPFWDAHLIDYAFASGPYFNLRGRYEQRIAWSEAGRQAARRQGRERDAAAMLEIQGITYRSTGRFTEAILAYEQAQAVYQTLQQEADSGRLLGNLGIVYRNQGRYDEAIDHYQQSLEIKRRIGDLAGTAATLGNLGIVYDNQGHYDEAIDHYQQSLEINRRIGDLAGTASSLNNLGLVYRNQGRYEEAIEHYQQSLEIERRIGNVAGMAITSWNLGLLYEDQGDMAAALPLIEEATQIAERIGMLVATSNRAHLEELRARMGGGDGTVEPLRE